MNRILLAVALCAGVAGCFADETVAGYGARDKAWLLDELDGAPFSAKATLIFPNKGRIAGDAPCNKYSATMEAPYPWFETGPILVTRRACPDLEAEGDFLRALESMSQAEVLGSVLILSNDAGREMVFKSDD